MSENPAAFVVREEISDRGGLLALNWKLFRRLGLFWRVFPFTVITIVLASAAPSFYRWYSAKVALESLPFPLAAFDHVFPLPFTLSGLLALTAFAAFFRIAAWALFEVTGMVATDGIHDEMIGGLSRTRTTFFDENPSGRILNRLVYDFTEVSSTAIIFVGDLINASIEIVGVLVIASFANPYAALFGIPLYVAFFWIQSYRARHLDHARGRTAVAVSKVIGRQTDVIEGRETFRLYGRTAELLDRLRESLREYTGASLVATEVEVRATFWIRTSAEVFSLIVLFFLVEALRVDRVTAAFAGVIISSLFGITGSIGWLDFAASCVTRSLPHLRRVFEFIELPNEESTEFARRFTTGFAAGPARVTNEREEGARGVPAAVEFRDLRVSYRDDTPIILDGLSLRFSAGEKVALVGRTGSGKSSLLQTLLRMVTVHSGDLLLDGESAYRQPIAAHRARFGVVPQSPYLFAGTVRSALDRNGERTDAELERALLALELRIALDAVVEEGGRNFSFGERQLICLARVLAAGKKIVLMDEPTSGLDPVTDARTAHALRTAFRDCTLVTIAHRKESLIHYDRVIELGFGKVVWEGKPVDWLAKLQ